MSDKLGASGQDKGKDQGSTPGKKKDKKTKGGKGGNSAGDGKGQGQQKTADEQQEGFKRSEKKKQNFKQGYQSFSVAKIEPKRVPDHLMADDVQAQKKDGQEIEKQKILQRTKVQRPKSAIVRLGVQYAEGVICGSNARCLAMLVAFKQFLNQCRLMSVSMGNAIKYLKYNISCGTRDLSETEAKQNLIDSIDEYIKIKSSLLQKAISTFVIEDKKIVDNDVIVVYACSSLVLRVSRTAHEHGIKFRVIVIDGRPRLEGKEMLRRLVRAGELNAPIC
ncbi:EIF2B4 [Mytilus edulis]|uniref:Translation initiation factor eIF2B subunit delta n=1 Tax=Mytilus edulis TaxID=6550 RepID=A0A8S3U8Z4_MYTED|nr:EIF2B4 [Mytilus edulis]